MFDEIGSAPQTRYKPRAGVVQFPEKTALSNRQRSYLDIAVRLAESSDASFKHGAVIVRGGSVLAVGVNKWKNRDLPPTPPDVYNPDITVHAEIDALSRVKDARGTTVYIARRRAFLPPLQPLREGSHRGWSQAGCLHGRLRQHNS
jgi:hypothetical protein